MWQASTRADVGMEVDQGNYTTARDIYSTRKKTAGPLAAQRYVATSVATGWLRLWFATAIGSTVAAAVVTHLRLQALAAD